MKAKTSAGCRSVIQSMMSSRWLPESLSCPPPEKANFERQVPPPTCPEYQFCDCRQEKKVHFPSSPLATTSRQ